MGLLEDWDRRWGLGEPSVDPLDEWDQKWGLASKPKKPGLLESIGRGARSLGAGVLNLAEAGAGALEMYAETPALRGLAGLVPMDPLADAARSLRQSFGRGSDLLSPERLYGSFREGLRERPVGTLAEGVLESAPQTVATVAAALYGGPVAAAAVGGGLTSSGAYTEARDAGLSSNTAALGALGEGAVSGALESIGAGAILNRIPGLPQATGRLARIGLGALGEGVTEGAQELVSAGRQELEGLPIGDLSDRLLASTTLGSLTGAGFSVGDVLADPGPQAPPRPSRRQLEEELTSERERRNLLEREANSDALTGLMNRRGFEALRPAAEADPNQWFVVYDLDNFKAVNDRAGHQTGDEVLRDAGAVVREVVGDRGVAARMGGDEFVQIVRGSREDAERVRTETERLFGAEDYGAGSPTTITGSVGETYVSADTPLQAAKHARKQEFGIPLTRAAASLGSPSGLANAGSFDTSLAEVYIPRQGSPAPAAPDIPIERVPMEMPEIVELSESLLSGRLPIVKRNLGRATGRFSPKSGTIQLRADLFADPRQAAATLSHEIGHVVDWLPEKEMGRGNILGRVASLKKHLISTIDALPSSTPAALTKEDRRNIKKRIKAQLGKGAAESEISAAYKAAIETEIQSRGLITKSEVLAELLDLSNQWRPGLMDADASSSYGAYRRSSKELYADAVSALVMAPTWAKKTAPKFFRSFEGYFERKPDAKAAYEAVQAISGAPTADVLAHRDQRAEAMLEEGRLKRAREIAASQVEETPTFGEFRENIATLVIDRRAALLGLRRQARKAKSALGDEVLRIAEAGDYINSQAAGYLEGAVREVIAPMEASGVDPKVFAKWLLYRRAAGERVELANPLGIGAEAAKAQMAALENSLSTEQRSALQAAGQRLADYRRKYVIEPLVATNAISPALRDKMLSNDDYARFEVQEYIEDDALGKASGLGSLRGQIGTLQRVGDPLIETMIHDVALVRMRQKAELAQAATQWLRTDFPQLITPAETRFDGKRHVPVEPADKKLGLFTYLNEGKVEGVYVPKGVAEALDKRFTETWAALKIWNKYVHGPIRMLLVTHNPAWSFWNIQRDVRASAKNIYSGPGSLARSAVDAAAAMRDVLRSGDQRLPEEVELMRGGAILPPGQRVWNPEDLGEGDALAHVLSQYGILTDESHRRQVRHPLARLVHNLTARLGEASERAIKLAGYRHLKSEQQTRGLTDHQVMEWVRNRAGTPNALRVGEMGRVLNAVFMFSNISKEGWRSSWESARQDPASWARKTLLYDVAPKMVLAAASYGLLDPLEELLGFKPSEAMDRIPESDKANYTIVPLGLDKNGKAVYLRFPQDHLGQAVSHLAWKIARVSPPSELAGWAQSQSPWGAGSIHPALSAVGMASEYAAGRNPYDPFRGRPIMSDAVFEAGGSRAHAAFGKAMWNELGGRVIWNFNTETEAETMSELERITQMPIVGSALQRFVKVSDAGLSEEARATLEPIRQEKAAARLDRDDAILAALREAKGGTIDVSALYQKLKADGLDAGEPWAFRQRVKELRTRQYGSRRERDLSYARSKEERKALEGL